MMKHEVEFYKRLFAEEERQNIKLDDDFWEVDERVTEEENLSLEAEISEAEVKRAIDTSYVKGV
jgi:4-hydroxyphenylpyruvate dioxygenase-like putative hemolysin